MMTSKEAINKVKHCGVEEIRLAMEEIEKDLDRLERMDKAMSDLVKDKPVIKQDFNPNIDNLNDYLNDLTSYVTKLSSSDNLIISAVYERFVRERKVEANIDRYKNSFKFVSRFTKKYFPYSYGKKWDEENGKLDFMLGIWFLQDYINYFAEDDVDIEAFIKENENDK